MRINWENRPSNDQVTHHPLSSITKSYFVIVFKSIKSQEDSHYSPPTPKDDDIHNHSMRVKPSVTAMHCGRRNSLAGIGAAAGCGSTRAQLLRLQSEMRHQLLLSIMLLPDREKKIKKADRRNFMCSCAQKITSTTGRK